MELDRLARNWNNLGRNDPLWAILAQRPQPDGSWDRAAFFDNGRHFVVRVHAHLEGLRCLPRGRERALDFGCGLGRLTQALASHFDHVVGVDIAASMIEGARELNAHGDRVEYVHNTAPDLRRFPDATFDFVLTVLVLQHMRSEYALGYIREFMRLLRRGGVAVFQASNRLKNPGTSAFRRRAEIGDRGDRGFALSLHPAEFAQHAGCWDWVRVRLINLGGDPLATRTGATSGHEVALRWQHLHGPAAAPIAWYPLPRPIVPGEQCDLLLPVQAPLGQGHYVLAATVTEDRAWIETLDQSPARLCVHVVPGPPPAPAPPPQPPHLVHDAAPPEEQDEQIIQVHPVPMLDVLRIVREAGCEVVEAAEDQWAGSEWLSAHYTVRKP